ncbi:MAG TPA: (d)CMP kinase [Mycobacteriales bacterium]|nr:(d)CMP kinase [Mycobacteriales bacterium]
MQRRDLVVAIDGPSGSGKSTVAREAASALDLRYLDTGAMYRAVTWLALEHHVDLTAGDELARIAEQAELKVTTDPRAPTILADGIDVTAAVRSPEVTGAVSAVSAVPGVRAAMVRRQREIIGEGGIVVEGRDIGSTVAPDAPVKIFLTADASTRAERRTRQDGLGEAPGSLAATEADLRRRDTADSTRAASPLQQAPDATVVDTSGLDIHQVVALIVEQARAVSV